MTGVFAFVASEYVFQYSGQVRHVLNVGVYNNVMIAAGLACIARGIVLRVERVAWILIGFAVLAWGIGDTIWTFTVANMENPPFPSVADIGFLSVYPPAYVGIVLLLRSRIGRLHTSLWLDGVIGALAIASLGCAVVFEAVLRTTGGSRAAVATNLTYPLADLTLIALVVWGLSVSGWRPGRAWGLIAAGLLVFAVSDCLYLYETAVGSYRYGSPTDLGWVAGGLLLGWAAWQPRAERAVSVSRGLALVVAPVAFGLLALGVLVYDHFHSLNPLAIGLAALTILMVITRMALTFAENMKMVATLHGEARTDSLTGLGNRRRLLDDLEGLLEDGTSRTLALFDLNGFKAYNDAYGHLAGDVLLARLGAHVSVVVEGRGSAYRLGGDEFCVLVGGSGDESGLLVAAARRALAEHGDGFAITAAYGAIELPREAGDASEALRLADQRMYANKLDRRGSAGEQSSGVLLTALAERHPRLGDHVVGVADLSALLSSSLGLAPGEVARARLAGSLHDIGKMAIPDEILDKPGPLSEDEWKFVRRHTLIGERILHAAPALSHVAKVVRSSHEHYDGAGYPDGLAGDAIPLLARIVLLCDAYDAMTSQRPYAPMLSELEAIDELRREAGRQFDPELVETFLEVLRSRDGVRELRPAVA